MTNPTRADRKQKQKRLAAIRALKGLIFCAIAISLLIVANAVMHPGHRPFDSWPAYSNLPDDSVQILVVGNSHAFATFAPMQMWDEAGVTSWVLGSGSTTVEQRLTMLQAGLKEQSPQVVLFELWIPDQEESQRPEVQTALYSQLPLSSYKIQGLMRDVPAENFWRYTIPLVQNHSRWDDLIHADFEIFDQDEPRVSGGARPLVADINNRAEIQFPPIAEPAELDPFVADQLEILPAVIEACEQAGADLIFLFTPVASDEMMARILGIRQAMANTPHVSDIRVADMNQFAQSDMGLTADDFYDPGHLYLWGMQAATSWLYQEVIRFHTDDIQPPQPEVAQWWDNQAVHWNSMQSEWLTELEF